MCIDATYIEGIEEGYMHIAAHSPSQTWEESNMHDELGLACC
jgi:hypothetical protein